MKFYLWYQDDQVGKELLKCQPEWFLGSSKIINSEQLEILGVRFRLKNLYKM